MGSFNIRHSIAIKLLQVVFVIYFSITITMTAIHMYNEYHNAKTAINQEIVELEKMAKKPLSNALWLFDDGQTDMILKSMYDLHFVTGVALVSKENLPIKSLGDISASQEISHTFSLELESPLGVQSLGQVTLFSNASIVLERVKSNFYFIVISAILKSILLWILLLWAFNKLFTRPITLFARDIEKIDWNNLEHSAFIQNTKPTKRQKDELTFFQESFGFMLSKILDAKRELESLNASLDQKVQDKTQELLAKNIELEKLYITDKLTGIYNRYKLESVLNSEMERSQRSGHMFGLILLDIDYFKKVNDTFGHQVGDQVLVKLATILQNNTRKTDIVGRWGGEEFMIICPHTDAQGVQKLAESLRVTLSQSSLNGVQMQTGSFGVTLYRKEETINDTIGRVDEALYQAKNSGRDRVVFLA